MRGSNIRGLRQLSVLVVMTSLCQFAWAGNAADAYRAAFGKLPADDKSLDILENWSRPVDDASRAVADRCQPALDQLHAGSVATTMDWGGFRLSDLTGARTLAYAATLKIHCLCEDRKYDEAAAVAVEAVGLGRRIGMVKAMNGVLVGEGIEKVAMVAIAMSVPSMPAPTVRKLIADLDALPPEAPLADAIRGEKELVDTAIKNHQANSGDGLDGVVPSDEAGRKEFLDEVDDSFVKLIEVVALPPEKMDAGLAIYEKSTAKVSSAAKKILPSADKLMNTVHKHSVWEAAFMAGLHVAIDGQAKLKKAFEYKKTSGGFQIISTAKFDGAAVVVGFGSDALK